MRLLIFILLFPAFASAQYDSTKKRAEMTGYGYQFKNIKVPGNGSFVGPTDTLRLAFADSGAIASKNGTLYAFNGRFWTASGGFDTTDIRYRPTAGDGISITGSYPSQTIAANPDTLVAGAGITLTASGTKKVTIAANTANLDSLYGGKLDSVVKRGDTLRSFAAGDSTLIGTVSGGGGGTLQEDFDADSSASPSLNVRGNNFAINFNNGSIQSNFSLNTVPTLIKINGNTSHNVQLDDGVILQSVDNVGIHRIYVKPRTSHLINIQDTGLTHFGVGTAYPTGFDVAVNAKFRKNGTPGTGKVPTGTDANGNWTWQTPASSGITTAQLTDSLNAREPRYKFRDDSTGNAGYTTLYQRNKLKDSLQANIDLKADTFNQTFTGRNTFTSTSSGVIIPRVTTAQMNAISSPTHGEIVYNTDEGATFYYTTDLGWMSDAPEWKRRSGVEYFSEFILQPTSTNTQTEFFTTILANSGTIGSATAVSNRPGIYQFSTSTSSNARSSIIADATNASNVLLGGGQLMYETDVQIPTLSNNTETFRFFVGLSNNTQVASVSSVAFLYDSSGATTGSAATGNWQVVCANASTRSYTTTSVPVVAGQWYRLKAVVNAAATQVQFYIDGTLVRTETSNIPATGVTPMAVLTKSNGTTARTALIDWFFFKQKFTTQR